MYVASTLEEQGHDVYVYSQDMHHYPDEHLTQYLDENEFDVVGLSFIAGYYQYRKAIKIADAINRSKNRPLFIVGGHGPTPEPSFFMKKLGCDVIVMGEGEETIAELLGNGLRTPFKDIKGIAWNDDGKCVVNERRPLICDIDKIPLPAYHLFPMTYYRLMRQPNCSTTDFCFPMLSGRGCTFKCNFCYRMDEGFRPRSSEAILEEANILKKTYGVTYISFNDELLMSSKERVMSLCEDFIRNNLNVKWYCNGRLNYATPEVLKVMKEAGCVFINYGIESYDDTALKNMNKALTTKRIKEGIEATLEAGISPGFNIIFGNIGENLDILQKDVDFLLKYDDGAQMRTIRPVSPYPGSPLYYYAMEKGLMKDCEDFYENKHVNSDLLAVNFTDMSDDEFHEGLRVANNTLIDNYFEKKKVSYKQQMDDLYGKKNLAFRGFRQT
jgi:anaerobic magnesium-protoporphyrin IX monomethyl ester cyclase